MKRALAVLSLAWAVTGCSSDKTGAPTGQSSAPVTYYGDVAAIFQDHCMFCHQDGGIGPFKLNDYATAKQYSASIAAQTASGNMPPWGVDSDGTCGDFAGSLALTSAQIDTIAKWQNGGALEGEPHALSVPSVPALGGGTPYKTPNFRARGAGRTAYRRRRVPLLSARLRRRRAALHHRLRGHPR